MSSDSTPTPGDRAATPTVGAEALREIVSRAIDPWFVLNAPTSFPRVIDLAYTAFLRAKEPNKEDCGATDWFTDTKPRIDDLIITMKAAIIDEVCKALATRPSDRGIAVFATVNGMSPPDGWYISCVINRVEAWRPAAERWLVMLNRTSDIRTVAGVGATDRDAFFAAYAAAEPPPQTGDEIDHRDRRPAIRE